VHEVPRSAVLVHAAVLGQAVGDLDRALEAQAPGAQLDGGGDLLAGAVGEVVQAADRRRRGVAGPQDDVLAVDVDRQLALEDLEALGEREVAVQRVAAAGRDLERDQRALAAALLARLEEGRAVALDRVVEAARLDGGGGCGQGLAPGRGLGPQQCADRARPRRRPRRRSRVVLRDGSSGPRQSPTWPRCPTGSALPRLRTRSRASRA
jgi:hypothetical protein